VKYKLLAFMAFSVLALSACGNPFAAAVPDRSAYEIRDGLRYQTLHQTFRDGKWLDLPLADPIPASDDATPEKPVRKQVEKPDAAGEMYKTAASIGLCARLAFAGLALLAVLSFFFPLPLVSTPALLKSVGVCFAMILVQFWINQYGPALGIISFWVMIGTAAVTFAAAGYPLIEGWIKKRIRDKGVALAAKGDPHGGAAIVIATAPAKKYAAPGAKTALKAALAVAGVNQ